MTGRGDSGFTLIEIIIVLVIMATLVGTASLSMVRGMKDAHLRDAVRTVMQYTRHARAVALVKQKPVVITFEEFEEDGEFAKSRLSLDFSADVGSDAEEGDSLAVAPREFSGVHVRMHIQERETVGKPRISVFSNVDRLRKNAAKRKRDLAVKNEENTSGKGKENIDSENEEVETAAESTSLLIEANGQCEPSVIRIWKTGQDESEATVIKVSRFCKPVAEDDER